MMTKTTNEGAGQNPFRPGMGLDPPYLADREYQLVRFRRYLGGFPEFPRNLRLSGLRGVGKTVLLQRCAALAQDADWVVVRRECSEHLRDESPFGLALVEDCRRAVETSSPSRTKAGAAIERALRMLSGISVSLAGIRVTLTAPPPPAPAHPALEDQIYLALRTACETAVGAGRPGLLLCHDEAHLLRDTKWTGQYPLSAFLAAVAQLQREAMPVMLLLCGLPTLTDNLAAARSYTERMFQAEIIGALQYPEDLYAFARPLELAGRACPDSVAEAVRRDTCGYPFYVQFYGALLWETVDWPAPIREEDFAAVRPQILEALDRAFFDARLARTSRVEKALCLPRSPPPGTKQAPLKDVRHRLNVPPTSSSPRSSLDSSTRAWSSDPSVDSWPSRCPFSVTTSAAMARPRWR